MRPGAGIRGGGVELLQQWVGTALLCNNQEDGRSRRRQGNFEHFP